MYLNAGFSDYLTKPIDTKKLEEIDTNSEEEDQRDVTLKMRGSTNQKT